MMTLLRAALLHGTLLALMLCAGASPARAHGSASVIDLVLEDTQPSGWGAESLAAEHLEVRWGGAPPRAVRADVLPNSIEWVRVDEQLVLPRARVRLTHDGCSGAVSYAGLHQALSATGTTDVPIAVVSGKAHALTLTARCGDETIEQELWTARLPRAGRNGRVAVDVGCSVAGVTAELVGGPDDDWVYVGCKRVFEGGPLDRTQVLDVRVHWDNAGGELLLAGAPVTAAAASVWELRLRSGDGPTILTAGARRLELKHRLPAGAPFGTLGLGLGPAYYSFTSSSEQLQAASPFLATYLAYRLSNTSRLVAFGGLYLNDKRDLDVGVYLSTETLRFLDRHASVNVLLGAQLIGFQQAGVYETRLGIPQGAEVLFRDVGFVGWNVLAGGFFYPPINDKIYASAWLRYGTPRLFIELNGMFRQEPLKDGTLTQAESIGISVGAPLVFFL